MLKLVKNSLIICLLAYASASWAILHLVLTQGVSTAIPIAIVPFSGPTDLTNVSDVISNDLQNSGRFKNFPSGDPTQQAHDITSVQLDYWKKQNVNYLIVGSVQADGNQYRVQFSVLDVYKDQVGPGATTTPLLQQQFTVPGSQLRTLAHHISDLIYQQITGVPGVFSTKIGYVLLQRDIGQPPIYKLIVADYDGINPQPILVSNQPIMSPAWSHDGKQIAYVSFESGLPAIYISNVVTGKRRLITNASGVNSAPAFSPDGSQLAVVLSPTSQPNIYLVNLSNGQLQTLTNANSINTEPSWSADGKSLLFTSDRSGSPQIYQLNLANKQATRITFSGNYNAHASFSGDGQTIALLHRGVDSDNQFGVATQNLQTSDLKVLSMDNAQSPSVAPNGSMIIYAVQTGPGASELAMISSDGRVRLRLPTSEGAVFAPAWSPYL